MKRPTRAGRVPVTTRLLGAYPVRTALAAGGIGLALMLMLLLSGLWAGVQQRVTTYEDHLAADLVVVPPGTESLFGDAGTLPASVLDQVLRTPGVSSASPIRTQYLILELGHTKAAVAAVASVPGAAGGPWSLSTGRAPRTPDEVAVDELFAAQHDLGTGDALPVLGHRMRIVGLTRQTAMFMTPLLFTTLQGMNEMLRVPGTTGAIALTTTPGKATDVSSRLEAQGLTVRTPAQLHTAALDLATRIYGAPVRLMVGIAFAAGTLIIALVAYTKLTEQRRTLAVLKALGATTSRIRGIAMTETYALTVAGVLLSVVLLLATQQLLAWWRPAFPIVLGWDTLARTAGAAAAMSTLAAWLPSRSLARVDPASAFKGHS